MTRTQDTWPAGATWVFQGTVAEDATAGTHVTSLTVTPGAGSELSVLYGSITVGNTATAQTALGFIDDGTNRLVSVFPSTADTTANVEHGFPVAALAGGSNYVGQGSPVQAGGGGPWLLISGTMRLILRVTTAAVSVTQTFALVCRLKGGPLPTATLNDTIGTSTNTTNTNQVF